MDLLGTLALILLTLLGYSCGAVLGAGGRRSAPRVLDVLVAIMLCILALASVNAISKWQLILIGMALAATAAALLAAARRPQTLPATVRLNPQRESSSGFFHRIGSAWKRFSSDLANYQGRLLLSAFYFTVATPFAVLVRFTRDPLRLRQGPDHSLWIERPRSDPDLVQARRQF